MNERKKKITYGIIAVICIILGLIMERAEKAENANIGIGSAIQNQVETTATGVASAETDTEQIVVDNEPAAETTEVITEDYVEYYFRNEDLLEQHYKKHGMEMGFESMEAYEEAASAVVAHPEVLSKTEAEDGDYVYYIEETNEFVVISQDGYIRTYFNPSAGIDYYNRQ